MLQLTLGGVKIDPYMGSNVTLTHKIEMKNYLTKLRWSNKVIFDNYAIQSHNSLGAMAWHVKNDTTVPDLP